MPFELPCPTCSTPMQPAPVGGLAVARCPRCGQLWCDRTELGRLVTRLAPDFLMHWGRQVEAVGDATARCPRCASALAAYELEGIAFARCPQCRGATIGPIAFAALLARARRDVDAGYHRAGVTGLLGELAEALAGVVRLPHA